jgi:DNA-binding Lrp family transcriptional regulator
MKDTEIRLLYELMKNSRRSDRELARALGVSQPTVSRMLKKVDKAGFVREYTIIPDLAKMGNDFLAVTFLSFAEDKPELFDKAREWTRNQPSVLFASNGEGMGMNSIMLSVHRDYGSYSALITQLRRDWQPNLRGTETFIVSLARPEMFIKPFSFKYLRSAKLAHLDTKRARSQSEEENH